MADSLEKNNNGLDRQLSPSGDSGEVPVDFEVEIVQGDNGNEMRKEADVNSINIVEGICFLRWHCFDLFILILLQSVTI